MCKKQLAEHLGYIESTLLPLGIRYSVTLSKAPESVNADYMSQDELRRKLQKGLDDAENENVRLAAIAFKEFKENQKDNIQCECGR